MKKLITLLSITILSLSILSACSTNQSSNDQPNKESYLYEITQINDNEIHGIPLNNISSDNGGIFLYKNEVSFNVQTGDKIEVIWGSEEDIFESITKVN